MGILGSIFKEAGAIINAFNGGFESNSKWCCEYCGTITYTGSPSSHPNSSQVHNCSYFNYQRPCSWQYLGEE